MLNDIPSKSEKSEKISKLIHSGRTSLGVILGFLEDFHAGSKLTEQDTVDAINSGKKIKEIFESFTRLDLR